ncbi:MAG: hemolysin activation protein [Pirellulaceae bacterium]|nr:MAG: hemolysin activation protein [Pirellulaceae bacterium]
MDVDWLLWVMIAGWACTLLGGLGVHVLDNFNGRRLEAYCRLRRKPERFGEILDNYEDAAIAAQYVLLCGLVIGSVAAGGWFLHGLIANQGQAAAPATFPAAWPLTGWFVSWLFLLILAGLWLPRLIVFYSSSQFLYYTWPLWRCLTTLMQPIVALGDVFSWLGYRLSDDPSGVIPEEEMIEDEIRTMVTAGQRDGFFGEGIPEMIEGVMELSENDVASIMTPRSMIDALEVHTPWEEMLQRVIECGRTRIPVYEQTLDNIIGILFVKDLLRVLADPTKPRNEQVLRSILRKAWFIPANKPVDELLRMFLHNRNHMAIVVDDYQQVMGVVTIEDALEEIVGEIADELDLDEEAEVKYDPTDHSVEAEGKVPVEVAAKALGVELPDSDDYDTVGGLVVHRMQRIPVPGEWVDVGKVRITVLQATPRAVKRVRLELIEDEKEQDAESATAATPERSSS